MNKTSIALGAAVLIVAVAAAAYTISRPHHAVPLVPQPQTGGNAAVGANGASSIITYTDTGFTPVRVSVALGTTVTWSNQSSHPLWIEAKGSQGGDCKTQAVSPLNECASISSGGTYSYTFTKLGTVSYVNHERTADAGIVTVSEAAAAGPINPNAIPE